MGYRAGMRLLAALVRGALSLAGGVLLAAVVLGLVLLSWLGRAL